MKGKTKLLSVLVILAVMLAYMPAHLADGVYAETKTGQWQESGSGTQYYAEFPSGYYTGSSLYGKYNNGVLSPYENTDSKREVSTTRVSYIYWHWTFNNQPLPNDNYNVFINDHSGWSEGRNYQFFADFESSEDYSEYDPAGHHDKVPGLCYYHWRGNASDGSWWWFRIPVYMQTYTDYKYVSSDDSRDNKNNNNSNNDNNNGDTSTVSNSETSNTGAAKKYTPKTTDIYKCSPKKNSCSMKWKKCSGKCTGYQIRYCTNKQFKKCKTKRIKGRNKCSCTLKGVKAGTTYYYQIRCYRKFGKKTYCSDWSKCKKFKTKKNKVTKDKTSSENNGSPTSSEKSKAKKYTPKKTGVSSCTPKKNSCIMRWKKCSGECTGYQIRYCTNKSFKGCRTKRIIGRSNCSCTLNGLKAGTIYYYQIRCYRKVGKKTYCSKWSKRKPVKTKLKKTADTKEGYRYRCIKVGNYVYCDVKNKIVKVNLKSKKITTVATISSNYHYSSDMSIKNGYLYFFSADSEDYSCGAITRVKLNGKDKKTIWDDYSSGNTRIWGYRFSGNRIYFYGDDYDTKGFIGFSANLDGSDIKVEFRCSGVNSWPDYENTVLKQKHASCNVKGYCTYDKNTDLENGFKRDQWLKTPKWDLKLGRVFTIRWNQ